MKHNCYNCSNCHDKQNSSYCTAQKYNKIYNKRVECPLFKNNFVRELFNMDRTPKKNLTANCNKNFDEKFSEHLKSFEDLPPIKTIPNSYLNPAEIERQERKSFRYEEVDITEKLSRDILKEIDKDLNFKIKVKDCLVMMKHMLEDYSDQDKLNELNNKLNEVVQCL